MNSTTLRSQEQLHGKIDVVFVNMRARRPLISRSHQFALGLTTHYDQILDLGELMNKEFEVGR